MKPTTVTFSTAVPVWARILGLRMQIELCAQRRHDPRVRVARFTIPLHVSSSGVAVDPADFAAIVVGIGGRLMPAYNSHFQVLPPRPAAADELVVTVTPEWSWFTVDLGPLAVDAEWREAR